MHASTSIDLTNSDQIRITLAPGQCLAILLPDGYSHVCHEYSNVVSLGYLDRYDYITAVLYDRKTGYLKDILQYNSMKSNDISSTSEQKFEDDSLGTLFPKPNDVITDSDVDFHFYFVQPSSVTADGTNSDIKPKSEWTSYVCIVLFDSKYAKGLVDCRCSESETQQIIKFTNISNGEYEAHYFIAHSRVLIRNSGQFEEFEQAFKGRMEASYSNSNHPTPKRVTAFSVRIQYADTASSDQECVMNECNRSIPTIHVNTEVVRTLSSLGGKTMHMLLLSCRSQQRYEEAVVMLKSLFYHRDVSNDLSRVLVLHFVLDRSGKHFFHELYVRHQLHRLPNVIFVLHDLNEICEAPLRQFLSATNMDQSYHHSGTAGYCRLFLDQYFAKLRNIHSIDSIIDSEYTIHLYDQITGMTASQTSPVDSLLVGKFALDVTRLITMETDQLVMADIAQLWEQFTVFDASDRGEEWLVAAAENYQPWGHSRVKAFRRAISPAAAASDTQKKEWNDYHGE